MIDKSIKWLVLPLILTYIFLIKLGFTAADIFAERIVSHNRITAITLDFGALASANTNQITNLFNSPAFQPGGFDLASIRIKGQSNNNFKYRIQIVKISGDDSLCNELKLKVTDRNFKNKFNGRLLDLNTISNIINDDLDEWIFMISLDNNNPELRNKTCNFDLDIKTYRADINETEGIFAQRIISNTVSSGTW
jgi:hypothetical protein